MKKSQPERKSTFVRFSISSSFIILLTIFAATLGFPLLLDSLGLQLRIVRVIVIGLATGFTVGYCLYFRDSRRGATRGFYFTSAIFSLMAMLIAYFWVFDIYFV